LVPAEAAGPTEEVFPAEKEPVPWPPESVQEAEAPEHQIAAQAVPAVEAQTPTEEPPADAVLTALFLEVARDFLDRIGARLRDWQLVPEQRRTLDAIQRLLHTLKGSARLSGLQAIGDLSHALESTLSAIVRGGMAVSDDALELAQRSLDTLSGQVDALEQGVPVSAADELLTALSQTQGEAAAEGAVVHLATAVPSARGAIRAPGAAVVAPPGAAVAQIRVRASLLDRMVNNSGE
jgi:chemosensory pili system protein ChpA (sensor histidine kinase/response regulator)